MDQSKPTKRMTVREQVTAEHAHQKVVKVMEGGILGLLFGHGRNAEVNVCGAMAVGSIIALILLMTHTDGTGTLWSTAAPVFSAIGSGAIAYMTGKRKSGDD